MKRWPPGARHDLADPAKLTKRPPATPGPMSVTAVWRTALCPAARTWASRTMHLSREFNELHDSRVGKEWSRLHCAGHAHADSSSNWPTSRPMLGVSPAPTISPVALEAVSAPRSHAW